MALRYLLDTNTASYIIKGNVPRVRERLLAVPMTDIGISAVTEAELRYGMARKPGATNLQFAVEQFLIRVSIMPWDSAAAWAYGMLCAALERQGRPIGNLDLMIAAHAIALPATLVTSDAVFERVERLDTEDWTR